MRGIWQITNVYSILLMSNRKISIRYSSNSKIRGHHAQFTSQGFHDTMSRPNADFTWLGSSKHHLQIMPRLMSPHTYNNRCRFPLLARIHISQNSCVHGRAQVHISRTNHKRIVRRIHVDKEYHQLTNDTNKSIFTIQETQIDSTIHKAKRF
jgi:hypothetical protein